MELHPVTRTGTDEQNAASEQLPGHPPRLNQPSARTTNYCPARGPDLRLARPSAAAAGIVRVDKPRAVATALAPTTVRLVAFSKKGGGQSQQVRFHWVLQIERTFCHPSVDIVRQGDGSCGCSWRQACRRHGGGGGGGTRMRAAVANASRDA